MITKQDPAQPCLMSRYDDLLSGAALEALSRGWQGVFRRMILRLLPIAELEGKFCKETGRPTKELYSVCGLLLLMEFFKWTLAEARLHYMVDLGVQYALNIEEDAVELSERTLYRYLDWLRKKDFMQKAMSIVTEYLLKELELDMREQRIDSTHVFSNMAMWSRRQLLFRITQRFLKQVRRHANSLYWEIDSSLRERYERNSGWIFGETSPMKLQRRGKMYTAEEQIGVDMEKLIAKFSGNVLFTNMASYKDLVRVFSEQFVDNDGKSELNPHPGGKILLNPSDPDAEIGHKGAGYQVQIAETCSDKNDVQLITAAIPQGGSESDMNSLPEVEAKLEKEGHLPEKLYADAGYGSDENYVMSAEKSVKLIAPAPPKPEGKVGLDECAFDDENKLIACPAGKKPMFKSFKNGKGRAVFFKSVCDQCPLKDKCRSQKCGRQNREFQYSQADLRTRKRRQKESTDEFRQDYGHKRCPIEGLNGRLKQFTPLRRLRIRGRPAVFHSIYAILTMHNIMQMVRHAKIQLKKAAAEAVVRFFRRVREAFPEKDTSPLFIFVQN